MSIVRQLLDAGLLDELHLFVNPPGGFGPPANRGRPARAANGAALVPSIPLGAIHFVHGPDQNPPTGSHDEAKESLPQQ